MQQNRDRNGRPRNTRPYDLNRDVARTSAPSQDHTPRSTGSSRYGYNGEPLSRPPSRSANGSVRSSRADNSIQFPTQTQPRRPAQGSNTTQYHAGNRPAGSRPKNAKSGGKQRRPTNNARSGQSSRKNQNAQNRPNRQHPAGSQSAPQQSPARREMRKKRKVTRATLRRRRMLRRLTAFAMLLCVIGAGIYLTMTMLFRINSIQVQTPDGKQVTEIAGYSADSILQQMGVQLEENIFSFDPAEKAAALEKIRAECDAQVKQFTAEGKLIEAQRIAQRTNYDIEMLNEVGICKGIENYSAVLSGRAPGSMPTTLLDYFPEDFLLFVDESHVTLPQVRAMYGGDYARKKTLVEYGFRLPSAFDNRPLKFEEVESKLNQMIFVSATPGEYERRNSSQVAQQVIRPTGLLDPVISVRPVEGQVVDLLGEINARIQRQERVLVTTLTKKMAEDLTDYLTEQGIKVKYMHHEVDTFERMEIIKDLRLGSIDVVVGINLLREGLDLPEVSLVAILDADKEGFLRSETSLIQTIGRAARNAEGLVILYADTVTPSMRAAMDETERRRKLQDDFNKAHGIIPQTIRKSVREMVEISHSAEEASKLSKKKLSDRERAETIARLEKEMKEASRMLEFEYAALLRDQIIELRGEK